MKDLIVVLILCAASITPLSSRAQNIKVEWSEKYKFENVFVTMVKNPVKNEFIKISYSPVSARYKEEVAKSVVITHYDKQLHFVSEKEIVLDEKDLEPAGVISMNSHFYLLTRKPDKSADETSISLTQINVVDDKIGPTSVMTSYPIGSGGYLRKPKYIYSGDSSRVLVYVDYIRKKGENQQFADFLINEKGEKIWEKKFEIQSPGTVPDFFSIEVNAFKQALDNEGNAYIIYPSMNAESAKYSLTVVNSSGNLTNKELNLSDRLFCDAGLTVDKKGNIVFCGLYKAGAGGNIAGYGVFALDKNTLQSIASKQGEFEPGLVQKITEDKQRSNRSGKTGISDNFKIRTIIARSNGDVDFIAEYGDAARNISTMNASFYTGDLLVIEYRSAGDIVCMRVPKYQRAENGNSFASFYAFEYKNRLCLFYNDCVENLESEDKLISFYFGGTRLSNLYLTVATFDEKGKVSRKKVFSFDEAEVGPRPRRFYRMSANQVILFGSKFKYLSRADEAIGMLTFN